MGNHVHFAHVCELALVRELGAAATEAIATRRQAPLVAFVRAHEERFPSALAGAVEPPAFAIMMNACAPSAPRAPSDVGLADVGVLFAAELDEAFLDAPLFSVPHVGEDDSPSDALFARCVEAFGYYAARDANELLRKDAWDTCGYFYVPPAWAHGEELRKAAARVRRTQKRLERWRNAPAARRDAETRPDDDARALGMEGALARYADALQAAARSGLAALEWVLKI